MLVIDAHAHIFQDRAAAFAVRGITRFYQLTCHGDGRAESLIADGEAAGVDRFVVHAVATTPGQVRSINDFILSARDRWPERIIPFAALHPDLPGLEEKIDEIVEAGFYGVKLHPDMQRFRLDEPRSIHMLKLLSGRLPALIHTGDRRYDFSGPERVLNAREAAPELTMICAHLGGWSEWDKAARMLPGHGLYVDTSSSLEALEPERAADIIRAFGAQNVLFGTDFPLETPTRALARFDRLPLTAEEKRRILGENAARVILNQEEMDNDKTDLV